MAANSWSFLKILIIRDSGSGKINPFFNPISHQPDIEKIYLYAKDPYEAKYQMLINKRQSTGLKHLNDSKVFYWILEWYGRYLKKY